MMPMFRKPVIALGAAGLGLALLGGQASVDPANAQSKYKYGKHKAIKKNKGITPNLSSKYKIPKQKIKNLACW